MSDYVSSTVASILGHEPAYWLELERRFAAGAGPTEEALLKEVIELRGKVSFYESRIRQMATVLNK